MPAGDYYVEITLEEMHQFLMRAFRALRPRQGEYEGSVYYDLSLSPNVSVRVYTSIRKGTGVVRGIGEKPITLLLYSLERKRPLMAKGRIPFAKRTLNWRDTLKDRIEDLIELYEEDEDGWERRAVDGHGKGEDKAPPPDGVVGPPPSDSQVAYALRVIHEAPSNFDWDQFGLSGPPDEATLRQFSSKSVSKMIDLIKAASPAPVQAGPQGVATFAKLRSGDWGLRGVNLTEGDSVAVTKRDGSKVVVQVGRVVFRNPDGSCLAEVAKSSRRFAADLDESVEDLYFGTIPG